MNLFITKLLDTRASFKFDLHIGQVILYNKLSVMHFLQNVWPHYVT